MAKRYQKLTSARMRKLERGGSISEHGIVFSRMADGDGRFSVNIMVDGQRIHRVVGRESDGTTRTQAEEFAAKIRTDAKHDRLSLPRGRKVPLSFREAASKYLERLSEEGGKDLVAKRRRLELHLLPFFGRMTLAKISSFEVERYKKMRSEQPAIKSQLSGRAATHKDSCVSPATINRELAVLSQLFNKCAEWGWIDRPPARIRRFKEEPSRFVYLTTDQAARLIECARADGNPYVYPFIVIGLATAMRSGEILSIRREDIDIDRLIIRIRKAKAGAREQPISRRLADFLRGCLDALPPGSPWLFPSPAAKDGHATTVRKPYRRVVKAAGLDPDEVLRHTLRHTAITQLIQAGVDLPTVKRISGHKQLAMIDRYAQANGAHIQEAMDKLERRYDGTGT